MGGILHFTGYAGFDQFYLEWIFLVPLLWAIRGQSPRRAFLIGWLAGIVGNAGGFYWVIQMFQQFAGMPWALSVLGLLLLSAANGIVVATFAWGTRLVTRETGWSVIWVAPVIWTAVEKFWPEIFPNYLGASQYQLLHLTQIADIAGILGVSFLVVYINATLYAVTARWMEERRFAWRPVAALAGVLVLVLGYGELRIRSVDAQAAAAKKLTVGLVQTNRGAADNHIDIYTVVREHQEMSRSIAAQYPVDLIVWPEGIGRINLASRDSRLPAELLGDAGRPLLLGTTLRTWEGESARHSNSALLADVTGQIVGSYDKTVLVPFGEYIPFGDRYPQLYAWSPFVSKFWPGTSTAPLALNGHLLSVNICYEDIFPGHIRKLMRGGPEGRAPEAMFNLTNDSWYGNTTQPVEHLALALFRSIENRRPLVRSTNTGISAFIDPVGRIVSRTGIWTRETLVGSVPLMTGSTVYTRFGDWIAWLCAALSLYGIGRSVHLSRSRRKQIS